MSNSRQTQMTELARHVPAKRGILLHFQHPLLQNIKKLKCEKNLRKKSEKSLTMLKKLKGGTLWDFLTSILSQNIKKLKGDPLGENFFFEKSLNAEKTERGTL